MAKDKEAKTSEQVKVKLNPATNLGGYAFDEDLSVMPRQPYYLTQEQYDEYSKAKHNGHQVIIKA